MKRTQFTTDKKKTAVFPNAPYSLAGVILIIMFVGLTVILSGCGTSSEQPAPAAQQNDNSSAANPQAESAQNNSAQSNPQTASTPKDNAGPIRPTGSPQNNLAGSNPPAASNQPVKAAPKAITLPSGTSIEVRLLQAISSSNAVAGSEFDAELAAPIASEGTEVFAKGTRVKGKIVNVEASGRLENPGVLKVALTSIQDISGNQIPLSTGALSAEGESHKKRNVTMIGGASGIGAIIGGIAGGKKGAAIGAASGAAAGTAGAYATGKKDVTFSTESKLSFKTTAQLVVNR